MKKLIAILLLAVYLFNLAGYSLYFHYFIDRSDRQLVQQIDRNNFSENDLTELKIPLHLPYYTSSNEYNRIDGEIELNGIHYNYVKKKVANDTLFLMCLPNLDKTKLYQEKNTYANQANDLPSNDKNNTGFKKSGFSNEYVDCMPHYSFITTTVSTVARFSNYDSSLLPGTLQADARPPEFGC